MNNFVDKIMTNHVFNSESSEDLSYLYSEETINNLNKPQNQDSKLGGDEKKTINRPTGGFPPIYIIDNADSKETENTKNRELRPRKTAVSIKDILKSKR